MADYSRLPILFCKFDGIKGFGERADLVHLNQDRISNALSDPSAEEETLLRCSNNAVVP
jgi:hypothetical protein